MIMKSCGHRDMFMAENISASSGIRTRIANSKLYRLALTYGATWAMPLKLAESCVLSAFINDRMFLKFLRLNIRKFERP